MKRSRFEDWCNSNGASMSRIAVLLKVTDPTLRAKRKGETPWTLDDVKTLSKAFRVSELEVFKVISGLDEEEREEEERFREQLEGLIEEAVAKGLRKAFRN